MYIFPSIDIKDGKVVRLIQGDYDRKIEYPQDPIDVARSYADAGSVWLHMIDLDGAKTGKACNAAVIEQVLKATDLKVQVGGGVRTEQTIRQLLEAGAERVIIGTRSLEDWQWFRTVVGDDANAGAIVLGMDAREGMLASRGWTAQTDISAVELAGKVSDWPLAAIVYTDIARDGMLTGPNFDQTERLARATNIPVIASGGIGCLDDVRRLAELPLAGIIIGRALYEAKVDLAEAIEAIQSVS